MNKRDRQKRARLIRRIEAAVHEKLQNKAKECEWWGLPIPELDDMRPVDAIASGDLFALTRVAQVLGVK